MYVGKREIKITGRMLRIARLDAEMYQFLSEPEPVIEALHDCRQRVDLFTFLQELPRVEPKFDYPMEWDNLAVLPLSTFEEWWKSVGCKTRNKARLAEKKGVSVREVPFDEALAHGIWEIYGEVPVRQGRPFPHFGKSVETIYTEEATYLQSSVFIGAFLNEELIGFIKLVHDDARVQAGVMNIVSKVSHKDKSPTNALLAQAVRSCVERGVRYMVYGKFAYGNRERDTVSDFKERNGFQRVNVPRYYVPLTGLGSVGIRLGLQHRFVDRLPQSFTNRLRSLRRRWYQHDAQPERS